MQTRSLTAPIGVAGLVISLAVAVTGLVLGARGMGRGLFRLVIAAAGVDVVLLVIAGGRIVGA